MKNIFLCAALLLAAQIQLSAQCIAPPTCPASPVTFCDVTNNDVLLWNTTGLYDSVTNSHDLAELPVDLSLKTAINCPLGDVQVSYVLLLDLDGDGIRETAVSSDSLSYLDIINFGNAANPGYSGGTPLHIDQRAVPVNEKYRFALEKIFTDTAVTVRVRWNTAKTPGTYLLPQLPAGNHRIEWRFEANGEVKTCGYNFTVKDCKAPVEVCLNGLGVSVMPNQMIQLYATDFLQYAQDNYVPIDLLKFAIRRSGTGTGFPVNAQGQPVSSVIFNCADLGSQPIELWAIDPAGNADYCETYVIINDNNGNCGDPGLQLTACAKSYCSGFNISDVNFGISVYSNAVPPFTLFMPGNGNSGCDTFSNQIPFGANTTVTPIKDNNPLNGVSTFDLVLISRHILGLEAFDSPFKLIAADANKSGSITTYDIVELRKLILGFYLELPNNTSWRFVPASFVFSNPNNPFQTVFPENITLANVQSNLNLEFLGVKIGDVNCTAILNFSGETPNVEALNIPNLELQPNEIVEVPVRFAQAGGHVGFQFGLHFDPSQIEVLEVLPDLGTQDNFGLFADRLNVSWSEAEPVLSLPDAPLFRLRLRARVPLHLAEVFSLDKDLQPEAYSDLDERRPLELQFPAAGPATSGGAEIFAPQPNPTSAGVRIPLRLDQPGSVTVEILDAAGRLVYRQAEPGNTGAQWLEVPATAFPQTGLYLWRVKAGTALQTGKIVRQ